MSRMSTNDIENGEEYNADDENETPIVTSTPASTQPKPPVLNDITKKKLNSEIPDQFSEPVTITEILPPDTLGIYLLEDEKENAHEDSQWLVLESIAEVVTPDELAELQQNLEDERIEDLVTEALLNNEPHPTTNLYVGLQDYFSRQQ